MQTVKVASPDVEEIHGDAERRDDAATAHQLGRDNGTWNFRGGGIEEVHADELRLPETSCRCGENVSGVARLSH
ncbi:hypothetical protein CEXT_94271 [Caerostris extrusa]|uniref:Uncharacterized protein n=1 Tax=Caerostris extrusa TaxID=172846 RepID=A0AAV4VIN3_CAEEX|nr:hypothetical protein CEXT_94271 [Caerostris extrusa]